MAASPSATAQAGEEAPAEENTWCLAKIVADGVLSHDEAVGFVGDPACGAIATFLGVTRNEFDGRPVARLEYEAYVPMAEREMRRLCAAARDAFEVSKCAVLHRVGEVPVGGASVIIAVSAPHRKAALDACAWLIDQLKATVPIWKKEAYSDGGAAWKENAEWAGTGSASGRGEGGGAEEPSS